MLDGDPFPELAGRSPALARLKQHMLKVARDAEVTVLVSGESGTGKERVARAIHRASPRHHAPFVVVNCAGLSPTRPVRTRQRRHGLSG
jgi:DNA-binding NtrC family response regulator